MSYMRAIVHLPDRFGLTMLAEKLDRREVERIRSAQHIIDRRDRAAIPSGGHFVKVK
jgi:hypothetical protein